MAIMLDTEGSEVHTMELAEPLKAEVRLGNHFVDYHYMRFDGRVIQRVCAKSCGLKREQRQYGHGLARGISHSG